MKFTIFALILISLCSVEAFSGEWPSGPLIPDNTNTKSAEQTYARLSTSYSLVCSAVAQAQQVLNTASKLKPRAFSQEICFQFGRIDGVLRNFPVGDSSALAQSGYGELEGLIKSFKDACSKGESFDYLQKDRRGNDMSIRLAEPTYKLRPQVIGGSPLIPSDSVVCH